MRWTGGLYGRMAWFAIAVGLAAASARAEPPPSPVLSSPVDGPESREPPARPPIAALRSALHALPCALLRVEEVNGRVLVSGTVAGEAALAAARETLERGAGGWEHGLDVAVASPALCAPLTLLAAPLAANATVPAPLRLQTAESSGTLRKEDFLVLDLTAPAAPAHLRVDYFTTDGHVIHLLPNPLETDGSIEAGATRRLGERTAGGRFWSVGPPFGQELLVALATPAPLFATLRPEMEPAAAYLEAVKRALADLAPDAAPLASALFITTEP